MIAAESHGSNMTYRARIYANYVHARNMALAPESLAGLKPRAAYITHLIRSHFPDDRQSEILELGCGHGAVIYFARQQGYVNICGVDGSPEQVAAARQLGIEGVVEGDLMLALAALPDQSRDCIVAFDVIEHFTRDELIMLVDEVWRVLRPGGRWIIHVPNGESPFSGMIRYSDITHELAFTRISIAQLLYSSGFSDVRSYEDAPVPYGLKSFVRWLLWKFFRATLRLYIAAETGYTGRDCIFSQNFLAVAKK
jgi:SAM-dependent methyltransferase